MKTKNLYIPICQASMSRDQIREIFDFESALEARCEKTTERCDQGGHEREPEGVVLHLRHQVTTMTDCGGEPVFCWMFLIFLEF